MLHLQSEPEALPVCGVSRLHSPSYRRVDALWLAPACFTHALSMQGLRNRGGYVLLQGMLEMQGGRHPECPVWAVYDACAQWFGHADVQ